MTQPPEHIAGVTTHSRRGEIRHRFRYGVDYVLIDPDAPALRPWLFSRNRFNLAAVHDCDHGGLIKAGRGAVWAREVLGAHGLDVHGLAVHGLPAHGLAGRAVQLGLLTQPRFLGYGFNPVSFWLAEEQGALIAVIAEVSTPFGDRHSYLCHLPDFAPITKDSRITAPKALHVSPFQEVKGSYEFSFDIHPDRLAIRILHRNGDEGVIATLSGPRVPLSNAGLVRASLRRPLGALRTIMLIYWQALRLKLKGARYRTRPTPPNSEVT